MRYDILSEGDLKINNPVHAMIKNFKNRYLIISVIIFVFSAGLLAGVKIYQSALPATAQDLSLDDQEATIRAIKDITPAVVSILVLGEEQTINYDLSTGQQTVSNDTVPVGSGTGFLITSDGLIITNKHVVDIVTDNTAQYKVTLASGKEYYAQLIGRDPLEDLAVIKIFDKDLPAAAIGDSNSLSVGSTVVAIGNSLGRYPSSATKGIVSGLGRFVYSIEAGKESSLDNVIQTDAEINLGNSGGPLIDLNGNVVGINVAIDEAGTAIGFAIPINDAVPVINSVKTAGRIIRPYLGVRYITLTPALAEKNDLPRSDGAWINSGDTGTDAVIAGAPAAAAGIMTGDIIFELNGTPIDENNTLQEVIGQHNPGDQISLKVQRGSEILTLNAVLAEYK